jgi:acetolactate synthase-1/2/3 large subunit
MLTLDRPTLDWVSIASSMGVEAEKAHDADELCRAFERGLSVKGPYLVEVVM